MTDHERLCELLKRVAGGITEPFCDCVQCDAARMLTCLLSKGPDGLRVVPVEPTKEKTLNEQVAEAKKEMSSWSAEHKAAVQLEGIGKAD